jgi:hypothetical protein
MSEDLLNRHGICSMDLDLKNLKKHPDISPYNTENFHPLIINKTGIIFFNDELLLLSTGLKYNLKHKHKHWIRTLA